MSVDGIEFTPTMDLRFVRRQVKLEPSRYGYEATVSILQQRFVGDDGSERWIDVPEIQE